MDVSFIIPARNERETLNLTVANLYRTVARQSFEVIVVDDHSSEELCRSLDPSLRVTCIRNEKRLGVARSRNIGAIHARGSLLIFLDAHVCFMPGWLDVVYEHEELLAYGILTPATFSLTEIEHFRSIATTFERPLAVKLMALGLGYKRTYYGYRMTLPPRPEILVNRTRRSELPFSIPIAGAASLCIRRALFVRLGSFLDELDGFGGLEDTELCMRLWAFGGWVTALPSICCFHYKARPSDPVDYVARPFHSDYYEHSLANSLRVSYLHLTDEDFEGLLRHYQHHPGFRPDLDAIVTDALRERRRFIVEHRVHDCRWLLRRIARV